MCDKSVNSLAVACARIGVSSFPVGGKRGFCVCTDRQQDQWKTGCALDPVSNFELRAERSKEW